MRMIRRSSLAVLLLMPGVLIETGRAEDWEVGAVAGMGFYSKATVTSPAGTGDVSFKSGPAFGGLIGSDMYRYVGAELRYEYRPGDLKLKSGSTEVTFNGEAHALHYDFLVHARPRGSRFRPFVAMGAGVKIFRGTGKESAIQPLSRLALLTKTLETKGLGSVGGGVKMRIGSNLLFRVEFRDFITAFPRQVIAPSIGAKISGLLHDFVPMAGISYTF